MKQIPIGESPFSLGFHTFKLYYGFLDYIDSENVFQALKEYQQTSGLLNYDKIPDPRYPERTKIYKYNYKKNIGIRWRYISIKTPIMTKDGYPITIDGLIAIVNPKIIAGTEDYITAANESDMSRIEELFNAESQKISDTLPLYHTYTKSEIHYCLNCNVKTAEIGCTPEQMMELIERGDIPAHFIDQGYEDSHYLKCGCAIINCYSKKDKGYPEVLRIEAQCKALKVRAIVKKHSGNLFSREVCEEIINDYFLKTVGTGNYYTLKDAKRMVRLLKSNQIEIDRLNAGLKFVNQCRGITKAKDRLRKNEKELSALQRTLKDLHSLGINPVTIPKEWIVDKWWVNDFGIRYIPTILNAYYNNLAEQRNKEQQEQINHELLIDYFKSELKQKKK